MSSGSMISPFRFQSYKVDEFSFRAENDLAVLGKMENVSADRWEFRLAFRKPIHFASQQVYVGGVDLDLKLNSNTKEQGGPLMTLHAGIAGIFSFAPEADINPMVEESLVKYQIPSILLPYLRSCITGFLASAGAGAVILPLINVRDMAREIVLEIQREA